MPVGCCALTVVVEGVVVESEVCLAVTGWLVEIEGLAVGNLVDCAVVALDVVSAVCTVDGSVDCIVKVWVVSPKDTPSDELFDGSEMFVGCSNICVACSAYGSVVCMV